MKLTLSPFDASNQFLLAVNAQPPPPALATGFYVHQAGPGNFVIKYGHPSDGSAGLTIFPAKNSPTIFATAQAAAEFFEGQENE